MTLRPRITLSLVVFLVTVYGPLLAWFRLGTTAAFSFFAPDAFYYLQIADQAARTGLQTFDGVRTTTGFHPLWGFLLSGAVTHLQVLRTKDAQLLFTLALSTALTAAGLGVLAFTVTRFIRSAALAFLVLVPGFYYLFFGWAFPPIGNGWSFANGLETPLSLLAFGVFTTLLPYRDPPPPGGSGARNDAVARRRLVAWSIALAFVVLARLDDVFLVAAAVIAVARRERTWKERAAQAIACGAVPAIAIILYVAYNVSVSGHALPSSAAVKEGSSFLANLHLMALPLAPFGLLLLGSEGWTLLSSKALHLLVPLAAGALWLMRPWIVRDGRPAEHAGGAALSLELLAIYVVLKGLYNLAFVWIWHQGYWYFPLSLLISSLLIGVAIQHRVWASPEAGIPGSARPQRSLPYGYLAALGLCGAALVVILLSFHGDRAGWAIVAAVCLSAAILALWGSCRWWIIMALTAWGLFMGTADVLNRSAWKYGDQYARFWADRDRLRREFQASSLASPIVEFDDGIVTYGLSVQGMSGFGLAADGDAVAAKLSGHLLDLAYERGFRTIASLYYAPPVPPEPRPGVSADAIVAQIATMQTENLRKWKFAIVLRDQRTGLLLVRFDPAGAQ